MTISQVFLAAAADAAGDRSRRSALYFDERMKPSKASDAATDAALAQQLMDVSEKLTGMSIIF